LKAECRTLSFSGDFNAPAVFLGETAGTSKNVDNSVTNQPMQPGQFPEALRVYTEMTKSREGDVNDMTLAMLHEIRMATMD
jgi:hypothetical protein